MKLNIVGRRRKEREGGLCGLSRASNREEREEGYRSRTEDLGSSSVVSRDSFGSSSVVSRDPYPGSVVKGTCLPSHPGSVNPSVVDTDLS